MSNSKEKNKLRNELIFRQSISKNNNDNKIIKLPSPKEKTKQKEEIYLKEPQDYNEKSLPSIVVKNKILVTPKKINTENSEIIIVNGDQTLPTVIQINHKLKNSGQKKITEKIPEKHPRLTYIQYFNNEKNSVKRTIDLNNDNYLNNTSKNKTENKLNNNSDNDNFRIPLDNPSSLHKSPKIITYKNNNIFSKGRRINNEFKKDEIIFKKYTTELNGKTKSKKIKDDIQINSSNDKSKKTTIDGLRDSIEREKNINEPKDNRKDENSVNNKKYKNKQGIEIFQNKNKIIINNELVENVELTDRKKEKNENGNQDQKIHLLKSLDSPNLKINNEIISIKNSDSRKLKNAVSDQKKKIFDITVDKMEEGKNKMEIQKYSKQKEEKISIYNEIKKSLKFGDMPMDNCNTLKPKKIKIKENKMNDEITFNNTKVIINSNKKNKGDHQIINNKAKKDTTVIESKIKEQKEILKTKELKNNIIKKEKPKPMIINDNFIKEIIERYRVSPPIEIERSRSGTFSKCIKNSSKFIFDKIISDIENKNKLNSKSKSNIKNQEKKQGLLFNPSDFKYFCVIGKGEYGKIYSVQWVKNDNKYYALKYEIYKKLEEVQKIQKATGIMKDFIQKTKSEGIVKIYGDICLIKNKIYHYYTLMEKSERDVEQECILRSKYQQNYTEKNIKDILCQLILTCSSLQKNCICHGDIKPQNILIFEGQYKLCDFGEVKIIDSTGFIEQDIGGTELFMSPKIFFAMREEKRTVIHNAFKSDVFSLALCILLMATFNYKSLVEIREATDMFTIKRSVNEFLSKKYSKNLIEFLIWMLEIDENKRPDFIELESNLIKLEK